MFPALRACHRRVTGIFRHLTDVYCMIRPRMLLSRRIVHQYLVPIAGAGVGFAGVCLFLASTDGAAMREALNDVSWWLILPTLLFGCANFWLRTMRWGVLLGP